MFQWNLFLWQLVGRVCCKEFKQTVLLPLKGSSEPVKKYNKYSNYSKRSDALVLAWNFSKCHSHTLLEGDFYLSSGKPACMCSMAQLEFLCWQVVGDSKEWGMATCCCGGEDRWRRWDRERNWSEKMLRAPLQEVNALIFSLENILWFLWIFWYPSAEGVCSSFLGHSACVNVLRDTCTFSDWCLVKDGVAKRSQETFALATHWAMGWYLGCTNGLKKHKRQKNLS